MTTEFGGFFPQSSTAIAAVRAEKQQKEQVQRDIYDSHRHRVFSLAFYMTGNEALAEEILTQTFVTAFQKHPHPDRECIDKALMAQLHCPDEVSTPLPAEEQSEQRLQKNVKRTELEIALQHLPGIERLAFLLKDVEGYPLEEISGLMQLPPAQICRILISAKIRLRRVLAGMQSGASREGST